MSTNPLGDAAKGKGEKSPTDPQECCDWANGRMHPDKARLGYHWVPTGNQGRPIELRRFV